MAITKALIVLGYFELMEEDQPKSNIWGHPELLEEWFDNVKARRNNPGSERIADEWKDFDGEQNELTKGLR